MSPTCPCFTFYFESCQVVQVCLELVTLLVSVSPSGESQGNTSYSLKASVGNTVFYYTYFSIDFYEIKGGQPHLRRQNQKLLKIMLFLGLKREIIW